LTILTHSTFNAYDTLQATPIATKPLPALSPSFFARPAEVVAPELIGCLLVKRQADGEVKWSCMDELEDLQRGGNRGYGYNVGLDHINYHEEINAYSSIQRIKIACSNSVTER